MSYTLLRECSIVLLYKGKGYLFDALSDVDFSQTYNRQTDTRKTLHSKNARPNTIVSSKNTATVNMSVVCTDSCTESVFLELIGMEQVIDGRFIIPKTLAVQPEICEIYAVTQYDTFKISPAVIESLDIKLSKGAVNSFGISMTAGNIERIKEAPSFGVLLNQGNPVSPTPIQFQYNNKPNDSITGAGISITQSIDWRNDRTLHDIGKIYFNTQPTLTGSSFTVNVTSYLRGDCKTSGDPEIANLGLNQSSIYVGIRNALVTKRISPEQVFLESYDVALTEHTDVFVEYGGIRT